MNKTTQVIIGVLIVLIVVVGASLLVWPPQEQAGPNGNVVKSVRTTEKPTVKIGVVAPLSGPTAFLGEGMQNAITLAKENLGPTKYNYEIYFEDDQLNPKMTSTASNKLISVNTVKALFSISSGTGNVITPLANQNKVLHLAIASDTNVAKGIYNFIHWTPPTEEAKVWTEEAKRRGIEKVAIIGVNQQGEVAIMEAVKKEIKGVGITVVAEEIFNFGEKDFKTIINKAGRNNPDIYLLVAISPELEILTKQMKELGITKPISGIESFELTEQKELYEGEWYVNGADPTRIFESSYEARFGKAYALGGPNAYDNFNLLVQAFETAGDGSTVPSTDEVAVELLNIKNFEGALGILSVGEEGIVISNAVVRMIKNGKPVTIS